MMLKMDDIYKRDSKGKERVWRAEVLDNRYRTVSGLVDGKKVTSDWKIAEGKNEGKKNATTCAEQAIAEAEAQYRDRLTKGYFKSLKDIDKFDKFKPMLAAKYEDLKKPLPWPVNCQPKLDGIRCIATKDGLFTRNGKAITGVPHVWDRLKDMLTENPTFVFDGELYNHKLRDDFNQITSIVRKLKPSSEEMAKSAELVQYHVYDFYQIDRPGQDFGGRLGDIPAPVFDEVIKEVPTAICYEQEELDEMYGYYLEDGYEGQMVRYPEMKYENKRSKGLLKRKEFIDEEFKVLDVQEGKGNWAGKVKRVVVELQDGSTCEAGIKGSMEKLEELWTMALADNQPDWVTVRFQEYTPDGKLRFGVVQDWGWGERDD